MRDPDVAMREKLEAQDWLTTVVEQEADTTRIRVTGAMIDFVKPYDIRGVARRALQPRTSASCR